MGCSVPSVSFQELIGTPVAPQSGYLKLYALQDGVFYVKDGANNITEFGTGTLTSFDITGTTGITPSGGPITHSGSITLTLHDDLVSFINNGSWSGTTLTIPALITTGNLSTGGNLLVNGTAQFDSSVTIDGQIDANGNAAFNGSVDVVSPFRIDSGPTITTGAAIPAGIQPDGSIYLRTGSPNGSLYVRENGSWVLK